MGGCDVSTPEKREKWEAEFEAWALFLEHDPVGYTYSKQAYLAACEKRDVEFENETDNAYRQSCYEEKEHRRAMRTLDDCHRATIGELETAIKDAISAMRPCKETAEAYGILAAAIDYKQGE